MPPVPPALYDRFVQPFYLEMMRTNAVQHGQTLASRIARVGRVARTDEVITLLHGFWRERVMGAWLAVLHDDDPEVQQAVLEALVTSHGSLDSPPLATAAVLLAGADALKSLEIYLANDRHYDWGSAGFFEAAIEHIREHQRRAGPDSATSEDRADFFALLSVAERLRAS